MIKKISLFFSAIAIGILSIFGGISLKNTAEPQYFLENTQVKNAAVLSNNNITLYFDNSYTPIENSFSARTLFQLSENTVINVINTENNITNITNEVKNLVYEGELAGADLNFYKQSTNTNPYFIITDTDGEEINLIRYNQVWEILLPENNFNINAIEFTNVSNYDLTTINTYINPYIGNLTSLPSDEPTPPLEQINTLVSDIINWFINIFNGLGDVFYDPTANKLTAWGTVLFIGVAIMLISMALKWVISLIRSV